LYSNYKILFAFKQGNYLYLGLYRVLSGTCHFRFSFIAGEYISYNILPMTNAITKNTWQNQINREEETQL
jgi:hypothetical protein